jgi:hypothetical protein
MKRNIKFYLALLVLLISSTGAWAQRIGVSNSMANGSVAVDNANPTGAATVTLTVTPAAGYYITASDITVSRTALGAQAPNRAPGIDDTKYAVTAKSVDGTGKGTYTFEVEAGYGAYIEATFTACSAITPTVDITGWTYGDAEKYPSVAGNPGNGAVTIAYKVKGAADDTYSATKPSDAGDYTVRATIAAAGHYLGGTATKDFAIEKKEAALSWSGLSFTYDGSAHVPTATVSNLVGTDECNVTVTGAQTEVGNYTATAEALSNNNYKLPAANTHAFSISAASMGEITTTGYNAVYDGAAHGISVTAPVGATVKYGEAEGTYELNATPTYTNVGTKTVYYQVTKTGFTPVTGSQTVTITAKALTITAKAKAITYGDAPANDGVTYNGFIDTEDESVLGGTLAYSYDYAQYGNVGSYSITPSGLTSTNYAITFVNGTLTVGQKEVGLNWTNTSLTYNGSAQTPTCTATGTVNGDEIGVTVSGAKTEVGDYTATATALTGEKAGNYKLPAANTQAFSITLKQIVSPDDPTDPNYGAIVVNVPAEGYTYDGTEKKPAVTVKDGTTVLALGTDYTVSYTNNKDAGDNSAIVTITGAGDYSINETRQFSIAKKALAATVKAQNKIYDGNTTATVTATVETGVTGETLTISGLTGTFDNAEVGTGKTVTINSTAAVVTAGDNTKTSNYTITYPATTTANITLKQIVSPDDPTDPNYGAIVVNVPTEGYTYDGTEKKPTVTVKDGETALTLGTDYTVSYTNNKDAGENSAIVTITGAGDYSINETRQFSIAKKALIATVKAQNKIYDGNTTATVTATVETGVTGETLTISGLTGTFDNAEVGTGKTVTVNSSAAVVTAGDNTKTSNYTITYPATTTANITLKQIISPDDPTDPNYGAIVVNVPAEGYTYDGTEKKPTVTVKDGATTLTVDKDYTVSYQNNINAGTATVAIHGAGDYTIEETRKFTIGKAALTIKANDLQREEGEENPELTVTYSGFVKGEDNSVLTTQPTISTTATKESPAGTYPITVSGAEAANYDITYTNGTLTILAKGSTFTMPGGTEGGCGIRVVRNDTGEEVANVVKLTYMNDKTSLRIDNINISTPADASASNPVSVTVYIPATLKNQDNVLLTIYGVGSDIIVTDANVPVTDIYMPETDAVINVAQHAFRLDATESKTARIHTSLVLLDDYALTAGLKAEYEAAHVMTTIKTTTQYWTLSSGVDLVIPDGVQAHTCQEAKNGKVTIKAINSISVATEEGTKTLLKANNGVLMKGTPGSYDLVAWPSVEHASGSTPTEDNAMSYPDNQLIPVIESKHFDYGKGYYVLKNGEFHAIKNDDSKVPACKAVFQLADGQKAPQRMAISYDDETMGIGSLTPTLSEGEGVWYTIDGQKLEGKPMTKGIYIINGKKTIIK